DLDNTPGNVTYTTDASGGVRFDMRVDKDVDGLSSLNLQAFGGAFSLQGNLDVTAEVHLHLVFGADAGGFYIDADGPKDAAGNPEPELVVDHIGINGGVEADGGFGILEISATDASLTLDPGVKLTADLLEPGPDQFTGQTDGQIRIYDLGV